MDCADLHPVNVAQTSHLTFSFYQWHFHCLNKWFLHGVYCRYNYPTDLPNLKQVHHHASSAYHPRGYIQRLELILIHFYALHLTKICRPHCHQNVCQLCNDR